MDFTSTSWIWITSLDIRCRSTQEIANLSKYKNILNQNQTISNIYCLFFFFFFFFFFFTKAINNKYTTQCKILILLYNKNIKLLLKCQLNLNILLLIIINNTHFKWTTNYVFIIKINHS